MEAILESFKISIAQTIRESANRLLERIDAICEPVAEQAIRTNKTTGEISKIEVEQQDIPDVAEDEQGSLEATSEDLDQSSRPMEYKCEQTEENLDLNTPSLEDFIVENKNNANINKLSSYEDSSVKNLQTSVGSLNSTAVLPEIEDKGKIENKTGNCENEYLQQLHLQSLWDEPIELDKYIKLDTPAGTEITCEEPDDGRWKEIQLDGLRILLEKQQKEELMLRLVLHAKTAQHWWSDG